MIFQSGHLKVNQILCFLLAAYLLNISVDAPDVLSNKAEDLTFNDQESVIEIVVEKILDFENSIQELDDNDTEQQSPIKKNLQIDYYILQSNIPESLLHNPSFSDPVCLWKSQEVKSLFSENTNPPPEV
ncbi:hypothetical protein [Flavobacterium sedimenticola]|uniref:Uncharacterized protein n=1 Tax=Flavobacterium sedimenticola TaxID=3043286 RepID=A0ABT6XM81_9FLAO|nr:hypothetical protein [Flavobacterium sedimenticola]MDI9256199.1 hypothetical protein [Flavobacterium sedimenticola]